MTKPPTRIIVNGYMPGAGRKAMSGYIGPSSKQSNPPTSGSAVKPPPAKSK